jgi:hypothetical protein
MDICIKFMHNCFKKIIPVIILGIVISIPRPSYSVWGVGDIALDPIQDGSGIAQTVLQVEQVINQVQTVLKAFGLDVVIYKVSQKLSQKLLNKVLNKANGGADGEDSKLFVENFGKYFQDISKQQIGTFTNMLSNSTSPFAQSISMGISDTAGGDIGSSKSLLEAFSLNDVLPSGTKWQDAANDVSYAGSQGWDFYGSLAQPQNSPLGAAIIAQDDLAKKIQATQDTAKTELTSSGFKPAKEKSGLGSMFEGMGQESFSGSVNTDGNVKTPTKTTEDQAGQSVTETFDRLRNADSFGKIIFGTIQQMIGGLIEKGFSSLASDGGGPQKLYGGPKDLSAVLNSNASWSSAPEQIVDLRKELATAIEKTSIEVGILEKTINSIKEPINDRIVLDLEYCVPGPDSKWEQRLKDYQEASTKDTQERAGSDNAKGSNNAAALTIVRRQTQQAFIETRSLMANPFLNIPSATEMNSALREYYKLSNRFKSLFDSVIVKRQVLTNLQTLQAESIAFGKSANVVNNVPTELILFKSQWDKTLTSKKDALYQSITNDLKDLFPEYLDPNNPSQLKPLAANDPLTPENETDTDKLNRVLDHQWNKWETLVSEKNKQSVYAKYISSTRDISDSSSVQRSQLVLDGAEQQKEDLRKILNDCRRIRSYIVTPNASANDTAFIETLESERIALAFSGPSILSANENNIDFAKLNERIVREESDLPGLTDSSFSETAYYGKRLRDGDLGNRLQIPDLAKTPSDLILQDAKEDLYCRLTMYHLYYWAPSPTSASLTGEPIGCGPYKPDWVDSDSFLQNSLGGILDAVDTVTGINLDSSAAHAQSYRIVSPAATGEASGAKKKVKANWYHTNNAEILFSVSAIE